MKILLAMINSASMTIGQTPILTILNTMSMIIKTRFIAFEINNDLSTKITSYYVIPCSIQFNYNFTSTFESFVFSQIDYLLIMLCR